MRIRKLTTAAVFTALALGLSLLERTIPMAWLPLPGVKLGLANIVTLVALFTLGTPYAAAILLLRALLGSLFAGSLTSFIYALAGGALAIAAMRLADRSGGFSVYGVSILGAAAHSLGQILAAALLLGSVQIFRYLPVLLLVSVVTGTLTGLAAAGVLTALDALGRRGMRL